MFIKKIDCVFLVVSSSKKTYQNLSETYSAIEPPTWALLLAQSTRSVGFEVRILDANAERLSEEEIFSEIFDEMFLINYTNLEGWESIENYTLIYPEDWSEGEIKVEVELDKRKPSVDNYDEAVHQKITMSIFQCLSFS